MTSLRADELREGLFEEKMVRPAFVSRARIVLFCDTFQSFSIKLLTATNKVKSAAAKELFLGLQTDMI